MRTLGKLLVIWGTLFPLITLPSIGNGSYRYMPFFDTHFGPLHMDYDTVLQTALFMVGIGPSLWVMPRGLLSPIPQSPSPLSGVPDRSSLLPRSGKFEHRERQVPLSGTCRRSADCRRRPGVRCSCGSASRVPGS
jgi:hypothetical protein